MKNAKTQLINNIRKFIKCEESVEKWEKEIEKIDCNCTEECKGECKCGKIK